MRGAGLELGLLREAGYLSSGLVRVQRGEGNKMRRINFKTILALVFIYSFCPIALFSEEPSQTKDPAEKSIQYRLPSNVIGVAFVDKQTSESYQLIISFPRNLLLGLGKKDIYHSQAASDVKESLGEVTIHGSIRLFDEKGPLADLKGINAIPVVIDCEDDGGYHYGAVLKVDVPKNSLLRPSRPVAFPQTVGGEIKVLAFAIANYDPPQKIKPLPKKIKKTTKTLMGFLEKGSHAVACFSSQETEASGGTDSLKLQTAQGDFEMGCPGP